jgi:hypothetical protein
MIYTALRVMFLDAAESTITIYTPIIYTAPCVMFLMWVDALCGEVGPSEIAGADRRVKFWVHE